MSDKPYVSHSQLDMFTRCGEQYRRRYIEGERIPPGVALLRGGSVHAAAELNHKQKVETRADMSRGDLIDVAATAFDERVSRDGYALTDEEASAGADATLGKAKDSAVRLTGLYADEVAPGIQPAPGLVEEKIRIVLPGPSDLLGILDLATVEKRVVDLKTAAKSKAQSEADTSTQLTLYSLAYRAKMGEEPTGLDMVVLVDTKKPKSQTLPTGRTRRDYEALIARVNAFEKAKAAGIFMPAPVGSWWCSARFCGYFATCPYVNSERKAAAEAA